VIGAAELAALQATANSALDVSIQVKRSTRTKTASGHFTETWNNVGSPILGNLAQPTGGQMQNYGYVIGSLDAWMVRVPVGTNLLENDRLVVSDPQGYSIATNALLPQEQLFQTLRVQVILQPQSYQTAERVLASAVQSAEVD
jgi:hypothetical protein